MLRMRFLVPVLMLSQISMASATFQDVEVNSAWQDYVTKHARAFTGFPCAAQADVSIDYNLPLDFGLLVAANLATYSKDKVINIKYDRASETYQSYFRSPSLDIDIYQRDELIRPANGRPYVLRILCAAE